MNKFVFSIFACLTLASTSIASPVGGPQKSQDKINPEEFRVYEIDVEGQEVLNIFAQGTGGDLDCYLFDENNVLVEKDVRKANMCVIVGEPKKAGKFHLMLKNAGAKPLTFVARAY